IRANNYQSAPGQVKGFYTVTNIEARTGLTDVGQFRRMVVKAAGGSLARIEGIGDVDLVTQNRTASASLTGQHAALLSIPVTPTGNALSLGPGVRKLMPEIERNLPVSVKTQIAYDSAKCIQASIGEVAVSLGQAVIIVVVVIFLFLGNVRSVLIPVVTIPLS